MSMFTACPACGSDWCSSCSCLREPLEATLSTLRQIEAHLRLNKVNPRPPTDAQLQSVVDAITLAKEALK